MKKRISNKWQGLRLVGRNSRLDKNKKKIHQQQLLVPDAENNNNKNF